MKWSWMFFLFWITSAQAQIFIQGPGLSNEEFLPLVEARQALRLSEWILENQNSKDILPLIHSLGTEFIQNRIEATKFKAELQEMIGHRLLNHETRQLLLDIFTQKMNSTSSISEKKMWLEASCHLLQLEDHWNDGYLIQKRACPFIYKQRRASEFLNKFKARVFVEGVELEKDSDLLSYNPVWKYHWHILSDNSEMISMKATVDEVLNQASFRDPIARGNCQSPLINRSLLEKIGIPLKNTLVAFNRTCFQTVESNPMVSSSASWKKPALILLSLVAVGVTYNYMKDHEIVFEF